MSYSTMNTSFNFLPVSPTSPNSFSVFISVQSPRDTHAAYEDLRQAFQPRDQYSRQRRSTSSSSIKLGLKKFLGGN
ncbi:hypothetical protein BDZ94DRAFT_1256445 [Collybia nuda]|uniref:Uncharacterized protein n=1 Tax=Collybia nuda TaxID=64659 RepID=A0A9P5YAQ9_9AGAR|nr:hypothetical protein BDZ94DRAFT_1256422 [Collybia nuda]KAF9464437.1 hypothetical protein BDZ94DRAFT_1256445 [Collybia nuda]